VLLLLYIERILDAVEPRAGSGYKLVAPEFPFKKQGSNQSTNADYLLLHRSSRTLLLVELKTDRSSLSMSQINTYARYKSLPEPSRRLREDLQAIREASAKRVKYDRLLGRIEELSPEFDNCRELQVRYLVPDALEEKLLGAAEPEEILPFRRLPAELPGPGSAEWRVLREAMQQLGNV
jgi:hypothetical protein